MDETTSEVDIFDAADFANPSQEQENATEPVQEAVDDSASQENASNDESASAGEEQQQTEPKEQADEINYDEFLAKKGLNRDDPEIINKVIGMAYNAEKMGKQATQQRAALERDIASRDNTTLPVASDVQALAEVRGFKTEQSVMKWKNEMGERLTPGIEQKMTDFINQPLTDNNGNVAINPQTGRPFTKGVLVVNGTLSLNDVYHLVGGGESSKTTELRTKLKDEVRKEVATRQNAKRPAPKATNSTQFGEKDEQDPFLDGLLGN